MAYRVIAEKVLVVERLSPGGQFNVAIVPNLAAALPSWSSSTRASPIFQLKDSKEPKLRGKEHLLLAFIGPIYPGDLPPGHNIFLSYGLYNVLLFAQGAHQLSRLKALLKTLKTTPWECWKLRGATVIEQDFGPAVTEALLRPKALATKAFPAELRAVSEEYRSLLSMTRARTLPYLPAVGDDLEVLNQALADKIEKVKLHNISKMQWLININAALSRFSSQTYAGTSPILGTECHFWTHSLLGIGLATMALLKLRRHIDKAAAVANFPERMRALQSAQPNPKSLKGLAASDPWWTANHLPAGSVTPNSVPNLPLIVCFSGRDGFKSTAFSVSAPLEVLQSANTFAWSLQTLTHEISHNFVDSVVASMLGDDFGGDAWTNRVMKILSGVSKPANLHQQLQELLAFSVGRLESELNGSETYDLTEDNLLELIERNYQDISELLAHVFDYLYFYRKDTSRYIDSIWSSWDAIPNIKNRVVEYVTRTLCAIHVSNFTVRDSVKITIDQLQDGLRSIKAASAANQYIDLALQELENRRIFYAKRLDTRLPLIKLAHLVLYSADIAQIFDAQRPESSVARRTASAMTPKQFAANRHVSNPLRFIADILSDRKSDALKSYWILAQTAFAEEGSSG